MSGLEKELRGLKAQAEATLLRDVKVTPEMKERLFRRIQAEKARRTAPRVPAWALRSASAAAAVAVVVAAGQGAVEQAQPAEQRAVANQSGAPIQTSPQPGSNTANGRLSATKVTITTSAQLQDAQGNAVNFKLEGADTDTYAATTGTEAQPGRKIVLNAEYALKVSDAEAVSASLQQLARSNGGYVVEANVQKVDDATVQGRLVLRIPSTRYGGVLEQIRTLGEVKSERQWSQDVTDQFIDQETRLKVLQEHEAKLLELAGKAEKFEDWLKVTQQLNETRAQIESSQGRLKRLTNEVEYSTMTIHLNQPAHLKGAAAPTLWRQMGNSFSESVALMMGLARDFVVGLAAVAPFLGPVGILAIGALLVMRRRRRA